mmetsp:Transcript_1641/g.2746  ORF Transcript_1641/g.2746 Transcript_1641/m.2746 type:complete len:83 (+) Transcript_1641:1468-1716(+)
MILRSVPLLTSRLLWKTRLGQRFKRYLEMKRYDLENIDDCCDQEIIYLFVIDLKARNCSYVSQACISRNNKLTLVLKMTIAE